MRFIILIIIIIILKVDDRRWKDDDDDDDDDDDEISTKVSKEREKVREKNVTKIFCSLITLNFLPES